MNERTAIFIDGAYLQKVLDEEFDQARLDFAKLALVIAGETEILRTYYYGCLPYRGNPPTADENRRYTRSRNFYTSLDLLPRFEVRLGILERRGNDAGGRPVFTQKRVDTMLSVDLVQLSARGHISQAALLAGDSDFIPAVAAAKSEGVLVRLYHGRNCHNDLLRNADERIRLNQDMIDSLLMA